MASFIAYNLVGLIIPSIVLVLTYIALAIVVLALIAVLRDSLRSYVYHLPLPFCLVLKAVFVGLEMKPSTTTDSDGRSGSNKFEVFLHGKNLRRFSVISSAFILSLVFVCATATMWTVLFIRGSTTCGEVGFDCFDNEESVRDCSIFENGTRVTINGTDHRLECYRFVFDYIGGFTIAGGVTFFAALVINTLVFFMTTISNIQPKKPHSVLRYVAMMVFFIFLALMPIVFLLLNLNLPLFDELLLPDVFTLWVYFVAFYFSIFACLILGADLLIDTTMTARASRT